MGGAYLISANGSFRRSVADIHNRDQTRQLRSNQPTVTLDAPESLARNGAMRRLATSRYHVPSLAGVSRAAVPVGAQVGLRPRLTITTSIMADLQCSCWQVGEHLDIINHRAQQPRIPHMPHLRSKKTLLRNANLFWTARPPTLISRSKSTMALPRALTSRPGRSHGNWQALEITASRRLRRR